MVGDPNEVSIAFQAELGHFESGIKRAETMLKQSGTRLEAIAKDNSRKMSRAMSQGFVTRSFQPYGVSADSSFGGGAASAASAAIARQSTEMDRLARRANVMIGLQAASGAIRGMHATVSAVRGDWEGVQTVIDQMPLGIGAINQGLRGLVWELSGFNAELESMNKSTEMMNKHLARTAAAFDMADEESRIRGEIAEESTGDKETRERIRFENELIKIERDMEKRRRADTAAGIAQSRETYDWLQETMTQKAEVEHGKRKKLIADEILDATVEANAERARLVEENRREGRQKRYRERSDEIRNELRELREAESKMRDELQAAQGVTGSNFVRSISTAMGQFSFGQAGGAYEVGRAQIRAAQLLQKIADNTKATLELEKEKDWIGSLR